jgi:hypothetical protein
VLDVDPVVRDGVAFEELAVVLCVRGAAVPDHVEGRGMGRIETGNGWRLGLFSQHGV